MIVPVALHADPPRRPAPPVTADSVARDSTFSHLYELAGAVVDTLEAHGVRSPAGLLAVTVGLAATWVVTGLVPGRGVALANALPLLVAGLGSGLVISPNVTLTLSQVPVARAGSAGGALQTGQRIGSAAGIAATGAVFYATLARTGDHALAFRHGLLVITGFVTAALVLAVLDTRWSGRRGLRDHDQDRAPGQKAPGSGPRAGLPAAPARTPAEPRSAGAPPSHAPTGATGAGASPAPAPTGPAATGSR